MLHQIENHLIYLSEENVIFALASKNVSNVDKKVMAKKLFKYPFNDGLCYNQDHFGRPIEFLLHNKTKLFDLVGSNL